LYKQEFGYAWRTLRRLGVRENDLPDLAHDLFIVVFRNLSDYDSSRPVRPWLFGIAFRVVSDYRRSARFVRETIGDGPEVVDRAPPLDDQIAARQAREAVMRGDFASLVPPNPAGVQLRLPGVEPSGNLGRAPGEPRR